MTVSRPRPPLTQAFAFAYEGILRTLAGERNMKIHWVSGTAVMLVGMALPFPPSARAALLFAVLLVIATEVLNAALEGIVDLATQEWMYSAKLAKDAAAGTVLVVAVGAIILLTDILWNQWRLVELNSVPVLRTVLFGVPLLVGLACGLTAAARLAAVGFGVACLTWAVLARHTADPVFAAVALGLIIVAADARRRRSRLLDDRPPASRA